MSEGDDGSAPGPPARHRRPTLVCLGVAVLVLGCCSAPPLITTVRRRWVARPFVAAAWRAADPEGRGAMVDDLLASQVLGRTRLEVEAMLGPSTLSPPEWRDHARYHVGMRSTFELFPHALLVTFDEQGRCIHVRSGSID